jgi:hypothetical protein
MSDGKQQQKKNMTLLKEEKKQRRVGNDLYRTKRVDVTVLAQSTALTK